jgi:hypothetical protein
MFEDLLAVAVGALLCGNAGFVERYIVTGQMDYRHRRDALLAFSAQLADGPAKTELTEIMRECERLVKIRDMVAHSPWTKGKASDSIKPFTFRARGSLKLRGHLDNEPDYTAASLTAEAQAIGRLYLRLLGFLRGTGREIWPSFPKAK